MAMSGLKKKRSKKRPATKRPIPVHATAAIFDGGSVKIEFVFQPQDARRLADQLVFAIVRENGLR